MTIDTRTPSSDLIGSSPLRESVADTQAGAYVNPYALSLKTRVATCFKNIWKKPATYGGILAIAGAALLVVTCLALRVNIIGKESLLGLSSLLVVGGGAIIGKRKKIELAISTLDFLRTESGAPENAPVGSRTNYNSIFTHPNGHRLCLGHMPFEGEDLSNLTNPYYVSLIEDVEYTKVLKAHTPLPKPDATNVSHFPTPDHTPVSVSDLNQAADAIHRELESGRDVYVHCKAGRARSAMVVAAYLMKHQNQSISEAEKTIKGARPQAYIKQLQKSHLYDFQQLFLHRE